MYAAFVCINNYVTMYVVGKTHAFRNLSIPKNFGCVSLSVFLMLICVFGEYFTEINKI